MVKSIQDLINNPHSSVKEHNLHEIFECDIPSENILFLGHDDGSYDGRIFVLYEKEGELYEVNDSHCSCYGFESWDPEKTTIEALLKRESYYGSNIMEVLHDYLKCLITYKIN